MKLVAIKSFTYAGKRVAPGDIFETKTDRDAKLLVGIKNARNLENREEAKIPAPAKSLIEQASAKVEPIVIEVKEDVKLPDVVDEKEEVAEPATEEKEEEPTPEKEEEPAVEEVKPVVTNQNNNKRTYNKRK